MWGGTFIYIETTSGLMGYSIAGNMAMVLFSIRDPAVSKEWQCMGILLPAKPLQDKKCSSIYDTRDLSW
jgi:hypothetical protein